MVKKLKRFVVDLDCTEHYDGYEYDEEVVKELIEEHLETLKSDGLIVDHGDVNVCDGEKDSRNSLEKVKSIEYFLEENDKAINSLVTISRNQFKILSFLDEKITQVIRQQERKELSDQDNELLFLVAGLKSILKNMDKNVDDMQYVLENHHIVINEDDEFIY